MRKKHFTVTLLFTSVLLLFTSVHAGSNLSPGMASDKDAAAEIPEAFDCLVVTKVGETTAIKDLSQASRGVFRFYPEGGTGRSVAANFKEQRSIQFVSADSRLEFVTIRLVDRNGKALEGKIENNLMAGWSHLEADHADWTAMPHDLRAIYIR